MRVAQYVLGKLHGDTKQYYEDGSPMREDRFINDLQEGEAVGFHPNGEMSDRAVFREGRRKGDLARFDTKGDAVSEGGGGGSGGLKKFVKKFSS